MLLARSMGLKAASFSGRRVESVGTTPMIITSHPIRPDTLIEVHPPRITGVDALDLGWVGLLAGGPVGLVAAIGCQFHPEITMPLKIALLPLLPLLGAILGLAAGTIGALAFCAAAHLAGGVEVRFRGVAAE